MIFQGSRYADRLPIGLPEVLKSAPRERLVAFYQKWYRPDNMAVVVVGDLPVAEAEQLIQKRFGVIPAAKGAAASVDASVPGHKDTLISMSTDPEAQGWTVSMAFKGKVEVDNTVRGYRKQLVEQLVSQMLNLRLAEISRRPNAPFLGAQAGGSNIGRTLELFEIEAAVPEGQITEGLAALMLEAKRMQQFGFSDEELNRAKAGLLAGYERAFKERGTAENPGYANEYVRHFLEQESIPGIEFEYRHGVDLPADRHRCRGVGAGQGADHRREPRRAGRGAGEEGHAAAVARHAARGHHARQRGAGGAVGRCHVGPRAGREGAAGRQGRLAPRGGRGRRDRADAVERRRGVAQAHRLQERPDPVHGLRARRRVAGQRRPTTRAPAWPRPWSASAAWAA